MWIVVTLLSALLFSSSIVFSKYAVSSILKNPFSLQFVNALLGLLAVLGVWQYSATEYLAWDKVMLSIAAGGLHSATVLLFLIAVKKDEVSRIGPLFRLVPVFIAIQSAIFLGETLSLYEYLGVATVVLGSLLLNWESGQPTSNLKPYFFMLIACFCSSWNAILVKYVLGFSNTPTVFCWTRIGYFLVLIPFFYFYNRNILNDFKNITSNNLALIVATAVMSLGGVYLMTLARDLGSITLVSALSSVQSVFVIALAYISSKYWFHTLEESKDTATLRLQKYIAGFMMMCGTLLMIFGPQVL